MNEQTAERSSIDRFISIGKDLVALLRDSALLILAVLLLLFPATFNDLLVRAGFEEGSVVGFKWKANLLQADEALKIAQGTIVDLKAQLDKTTKVLGEVRIHPDDRSMSSAISKLEEENRLVVGASKKVEASVRSTIDSNAAFVEKAQSAINTGGGWGVVFGSDVSLPAAQDEIKRAARNKLASTRIYYRNGYYVSIAVTDNRSSAQEYLGVAKTFRPDAYITPMGTWCRSPQERSGFTECVRP